MVSLHACDTATDDALAQAIRWQADVILAVPCCQKEAYGQIESSVLAPLLRHGLAKERFAALVTDALRAHLLELEGYRTQLVEFVPLEHTAKNVLIRAVRGRTGRSRRRAVRTRSCATRSASRRRWNGCSAPREDVIVRLRLHVAGGAARLGEADLREAGGC